MAALAVAADRADAAGPPTLGDAWSTQVVATSARLHAEIDPEGLPTTYRFEYLTEAAYEANLGAGQDAFAGASRAPSGAEASAGEGSSFVPVKQVVAGLSPSTPYRYRALAKNGDGAQAGETRLFITQGVGGASPLLDGRAWEVVSPREKNGGQVGAPGSIFGGGDVQAAAGGGKLTFSSLGSFGDGAAGAPPASQYVATRTGSGWAIRNVTAPTPSGGYGDEPDGVPYRLFSADLARAAMLDGRRCEAEEECPRSYSLRDGEGGELGSTPAVAGLDLAAATPSLGRVLFGSVEGLYGWSAGGALEAISAEPGAAPAAPIGAISVGGQRVYWVDEAGALHLFENGASRPLDESGQAEFQIASASGGLAFYLKEGVLHRYDAGSESSDPIATGVSGVLGASDDGAVVYYQTSTALERWREGSTSEVAAGADAALAGNWPPATGTSRVSADGSALAFLSKARLTGYDNTDQSTGQPATELFLWREGGGLACVSCNPTNQRPIGAASIPGAIANGTTRMYRPRAMAAGGRRLFFESADALALSDTNGAVDVYEWEAAGTGSCTAPSGCLGLISSGRAKGGAVFLDASESGADAYFLTARSLVASDSGLPDVYDAREGGGFPKSPVPIACAGDACQSLPSEPEDPEPGTLLAGPGNARLHHPALPCPKGKRRVKRRGKVRCRPSRRAARRHGHRRQGHRQGEGGRR